MAHYNANKVTVVCDDDDISDKVFSCSVVQGISELWGTISPYTVLYLTTELPIPLKKGDICHFQVIDPSGAAYEDDMELVFDGVDLSTQNYPRYIFKKGAVFTDGVTDIIRVADLPPDVKRKTHDH